jgi:hypothetical protein
MGRHRRHSCQCERIILPQGKGFFLEGNAR